MLCCHCQANIRDGAHFCTKCGKPQNTIVIAPANHHVPDSNAPIPHVATSEFIQEAPVEEGTKQQAASAQLYNQL